MTDGQNLDAGVPDVQPSVVPTEKMVAQSEVDRVVGASKHEAYERGKREAMQMAGPGAAQTAQGAMSEDQVLKIIQEQTQKAQQEAIAAQQQQAQQQMAEKIVGEFSTKMNEGSKNYEDFHDVVKVLDLQHIPDIVQLANSVPNTADVMYELGKNPEKVAMIRSLIKDRQYAAAHVAMTKLSGSIEANKKALENVQPSREPLSQMKASSTNKPVEGGVPNLDFFKSQKWARG